MVLFTCDFRPFFLPLGPGKEQKAENPIIFSLTLKGIIGFSDFKQTKNPTVFDFNIKSNTKLN